jgi:hypothetical protein
LGNDKLPAGRSCSGHWPSVNTEGFFNYTGIKKFRSLFPGKQILFFPVLPVNPLRPGYLTLPFLLFAMQPISANFALQLFKNYQQ